MSNYIRKSSKFPTSKPTDTRFISTSMDKTTIWYQSPICSRSRYLSITWQKGTKYLQSMAGSFIYYSWAIDSTILVALNKIAAHQASPTQFNLFKCRWLLDYAVTFTNIKFQFVVSDKILHIDSDSAYLVQDGARSCIAGHYILSLFPPPTPQISKKAPNAPILIECKILRNVVVSAAEAKTGGLFHNAQTILHIHVLLKALGHCQPPTPLKTDNSMANIFVHKSLNQWKSKSWDMKFHWLRDKEL